MRLKASYIVIAGTMVLLALLNAACKKTRVQTVGGALKFSVDTLKFDTVFTAAGSYTNGLVIYNPGDAEITVSSVRLQHGTTSYFHLNVDGFAGNNIPNLKIAPHDSIYVFATVNIDSSNKLTPFYIQDSLVATLNGTNYYLPFTAYGQNAHYIISDSITKDITWLTDKPYVVIHSCVIGYGVTLTIPAKCRVYMHQDARFFVYGLLLVDPTGTPGQDSVVFQGDRLDRVYFGYMGYPGEWGGFYFVGSTTPGAGGQGYFRNAVIENCGGSTPYWNYGIQPAAVEVDNGAHVILDHSIVRNSIGYGILGFQGWVFASNCLVHTCGAQTLGIIQGGQDTMINCTFANYGTAAVSHINNPTVGILNYLSNGDGTWQPGNLTAVLTNCIIYGSLDSELYCDSLAGATASLKLDHCLFGTGFQIEHFVQMTGCIVGQAPKFIDPMFKSPSTGDFHLQAGSPAINAGNPAFSVGVGLDGVTQSSANGDIGCYQYH
jgi:hypothetical protein